MHKKNYGIFDAGEILDEPREECGVFGMYDFSGEENVAPTIYYGLLALQHRGQESCGIAVSNTEGPKGKVMSHKGMGLVNECILPRYYGIETYRFQQFDGLMPTWNTRLPSLPYDASRKERIEAEILESDLVTFDVFDTLLVRKVLFPRDVFALTERRAKESGLEAEHFAARRAEAESESQGGTIDRIYAWLRKEYGWDEAQADKVKTMELTIEREVTAPRREVVDLLDFAVKHGKKVVFVSDMYLPEARMSALLAEKGIDGYERILVSCDEGCDKAHGLFARLKAQYPEAKHILHIGDHPHADGTAAKAEGIKTEILPSPLAMAMDSGWKTGSPACRASSLTGEKLTVMPRPRALSGWVNTPTTCTS